MTGDATLTKLAKLGCVRRTSLPILILVVAAAPWSSGCSAKRVLTAEENYTQASEYFDTGAYELAIESYKELLDQHPFTEHAADAEMKIAESHYLMARYAEAIAAYGDFERMHPTSPLIPRVTYYLGMAHLKQMRPLDRDQSASDQAYAYFRAVIDRYPGSPWAERAGLRLRECQESLAAHELYIARFYLRRKNLLAAEARFGHILRAYPDTDAAAHALLLFGDAYSRRDLDRPAALAYRALLVRHPEDPDTEQARHRLGGLPDGGASVNGEGDPLQALLAERLSPRGATAADAGFTAGAPGPSFSNPSSSDDEAGAADPVLDPASQPLFPN